MPLRRRCSALTVLAALVVLAAAQLQAQAIRADEDLVILLCRSSNAGAVPADRGFDYYDRMLRQIGAGGVADYWWDMSLGTYDMRNAELRGWFTVAKTTADWGKGGTAGKIDACIAAAKADANNSYTVPAGRRVVVIGYPWVGVQAVGDRALISWDSDVGTFAHEAGHALGLQHSYSTDVEYVNAWWAERGEYHDPWDAMSWANSFSVGTPFGNAPVYIAGPVLEKLGWLPRSRIITVGADGTRSGVYRLSALSHPEVAGPLLLRVPFDLDDPGHYFTVEFRQQDRWDAGIPASTVLIHEVGKVFTPSGQYKGRVPRLLRDRTHPDRRPLDMVVRDGLIIRVTNIDPAAHTADIAVVSDFAVACLPSFVWREIASLDLTCIPKADRALVRSENGQHGGFTIANGAFGPNTCKQGYVWRDAIPKGKWADYEGDQICVTTAGRTREMQNNANAPARTNPARLTHGPNACRPGFVWREADDWDWICVVRTTRTATLDENNLAASRRNPAGGPYGPDTCLSGFVWREAFPGDRVCVPFASRQRAINDNMARHQRWVAP